MKKKIIIVLSITAVIVLVTAVIGIAMKNSKNENDVVSKGNSKSKNDVANKIYTYTGEGFGGDFTITINDDGTASFYEGYLSSYIGEGTWSAQDDILLLNDNTFKNKFKIHGDELEFIEEGSMNFPYVKVKDGDRFVGKPLE